MTSKRVKHVSLGLLWETTPLLQSGTVVLNNPQMPQSVSIHFSYNKYMGFEWMLSHIGDSV